MLEELRQLYFSDDCLSPEQIALRDVYRPQARTSQKHQLEDQTNDESARYDKKAKGQDMGFAGASVTANQCGGYTEWVLGPESTTNDVVKLYAPSLDTLEVLYPPITPTVYGYMTTRFLLSNPPAGVGLPHTNVNSCTT
ncbi:hypothetical protein VN97_g7768 [Penicillium thymicola]|uniref:Uncharacterized protein n=1 Tax=Penicillium thymicola TaxID=293382 RepID=A0AAI9TFR5_PENTH|nr:hypothetical protein VN97_g7768 [Penicillium thymicola]